MDELFELARELKADRTSHSQALAGRSLAMIFQKPSTRTRVSFEVGMFQLGGTALYLGPGDIQLNRGESVGDTAKVLSRFCDAILARVFSHQDILDLARSSAVPVINGLSDLLHPCQALADYFTLLERHGSFDGLKIAYIGDGNNVCHELMLGAAILGMRVSVATPEGYAPSPVITKAAAREAQKVRIPGPEILHDPLAAAEGANAVYTDVWTSMGQESEAQERLLAFEGYCVTQDVMAAAAADAVFMHCLPAHRGEEVTAEVIDGPQSVVFDQAENRLHVQKALLLLLLGAA